ncbi:MAG: sigma-70 family RNA polymerase sigma factor [Rhodobacter sp.]|nr:sigma-70 family RNA polymerase sigma factor [Rhodobacter sp.]
MSYQTVIESVDSDQVDFGAQWAEHYGVLMGRARRLAAGSPQEPEDLLSQATVKVLNYLRLEREITSFVGLMLVSMMQVHIDAHRRLNERVFYEADEYSEHGGRPVDLTDLPDAERSYIAKQTLADIQDFLRTLPPVYRDLFHMRFIDEMPFAEISRRLGISEANARQKIRTLRGKLKVWAEQ